MKNSIITIVIPTYNRRDYLQKCIESALNQTVTCEIIVCDHGSTDGTLEMMDRYKTKVKYIRREVDLGLHFVWLDGVLNATNDWIHLNFDDDWIEPEFIYETQLMLGKDIGCIFTDAKIYDEQSGVFKSSDFFGKLNSGIHDSKYLEKFSLKKLASPGAAVFRRQLLIDYLYIGRLIFTKHEFKGVGPDLLFSLFSAYHYPKFGFIKKELAVFRSHENSITIDAFRNKEKQEKIEQAYDEARIFYLMYKTIIKSPLYSIIKYLLKIKK
jgi:glycosyltransferase involved in cell wall biosynthesis